MDSRPNDTGSFTHISGGAFYDVAGSVNQTFYSYTPRGPDAVNAGPMASGGSSLVVRSQRSSRQATRPAAHSGRNRSTHNQVADNDHGSQQDTTYQQLSQHEIISSPYATPSGDQHHITYPQQADNNHSFQNTTYRVRGDMTVASYAGESALDFLHRHVVTEALHNSGESFPEPACHPGTRTKIMNDLMDWATDPNANPVLWLHGTAGAGKSAVAQEFASKCSTQGYLGASFFFRRGHPKRGTWDGLINTIAYQLAIVIPEFSLPLQQIINSNRLIANHSIPLQFQKSLVETFRCMPQTSLPLPIVVLDGLDECADVKNQQQILQLFLSKIQTGHLPLRLLVASRPETHLRKIFDAAPTSVICSRKCLDADVTAYNDIRTYLRDEFSRISSEFLAQGVALDASWPGREDLEQLVRRSSGVFIFAKTAIRFIDDGRYSHPAVRLAAVMSGSPESTTPLDDLYSTILSVLPHEPLTLRILHVALCFERPRNWNPWSPDIPEECDLLLGIVPGMARLILSGLHSVLHIPRLSPPYSDLDTIRTLHASFSDYLSDVQRSGKWCIQVPSLERDLLKSILHFLCNPDFTHRQTLRRETTMLVKSLMGNHPLDNDLLDLLRQPLSQDAIMEDPGVWPEIVTRLPPDLIKFWEERNWISEFVHNFTHDEKVITPCKQFDPLYTAILTENPGVLWFLQIALFCNRPFPHPRLRGLLKRPPPGFRPQEAFRPWGLTCRDLKPLLSLRKQGYPAYIAAAIRNFLSDSKRAGDLHVPLKVIYEQWMLKWIKFAQQPLDNEGERLICLK
ncbi:hypothetical protein GGX14DRAFT_457711 [Mycena pura]|uniref:Nephrocystin 3-like N-terminal domain-containing protein n=1 Tax=Mycena pura TaxID=153505 RepID=A0AAD6VDA7_9AGAR|nr:hypothetical protein GGX14DRAFT_457711 [Mycena pura]